MAVHFCMTSPCLVCLGNAANAQREIADFLSGDPMPGFEWRVDYSYAEPEYVGRHRKPSP
jgi:hypothetical protein